MAALDTLVACAGRWVGKSRLQDPHNISPDLSASTATITPVLGGRFVRLDYTWAYRDTPQEGSFLIGYDQGLQDATAYWIDSWHLGDKGMTCQGPMEAGGHINLRGSYAAPPGPDWGWRTLITPASSKLLMVMYNITPDGQEEVAVEAEYSRG